MPKETDIADFAQRVERLCDFLISKADKDGSNDILVIQQLKEDAADLQFLKSPTSYTIHGLFDYMHGGK